MKKFEGHVVGNGMKIGIVAARFNEFIVSKLIGGAEDALVRHGVDMDQVDLAWVPGAFEIPLVAQKMAASGKYDAVICLGAVIKGSTSHYDYVCAEVSKGVATVGLNTGVPTLFGVLTTDNIEQAIERAGTNAGHKGYDVACSAIEMVNLVKEIEAYFHGSTLSYTRYDAGKTGVSAFEILFSAALWHAVPAVLQCGGYGNRRKNTGI